MQGLQTSCCEVTGSVTCFVTGTNASVTEHVITKKIIKGGL